MNLITVRKHSKSRYRSMPLAQRFRSPLNNISLALEMFDDLLVRANAGQYELLPEEIKVYLEIIKKSEHHIEEIVAELPFIGEGIYKNQTAACVHNGILAIAEEACA
jgi:hypothetical protein